MSCNTKSLKNCHYKSCERYYNASAQPFAADATIPVQIAGTRVTDTGISIETEPMSFTVLKNGLYHLSADATITATVAGSGTLTAYLDGIAMPCTVRSSVLEIGANELHTETDIVLSGCCCDQAHTITFQFASDTAVGSITLFCSGLVKMA